MLGRHCVKHWSKTQACVALSSGEAELYAIIKGVQEGMGMQTLMAELGRKATLKLNTDSSAAKGAAVRTGCGRLKHLLISNLWVQERVSCGDVDVRKIGREGNYADLFTHFCSVREGNAHLTGMGAYTPAVA